MSAEQWRSIVAKYFKPEDIDKAIYVIDHESGGNAGAVGDNGASHGLFQLNDNGLGSGMSVADRLDPEKNIATAAKAVYGGSGWKPWGEGSLYNGKAFGSLGNNPYGGTAVNGRAETGSGVGSTGASTVANDTSGSSDYDNGTTNYIISVIGPPPKQDDPSFATVPAYDVQGRAIGDRPATVAEIQEGFLAALKSWGETAVSIGRSYQLTHPTKSLPNPNQLTREDLLAQQDITNANNAGTQQHNANADALAKSAQDITSFYNGRSDTVARQGQIAAGQKELSAYGVPKPGAQDLSYADLGRSEYAKAMGYDPNGASRHIMGTQWIDPQSQMSANDNLLGVGGAPPQSANLLTGDTDPASSGYMPSATPPPVSLSGAIAGMQPNLLSGLPPGYGATAGLGDATTPANAASGVKGVPSALSTTQPGQYNLLTGGQQAAKTWTALMGAFPFRFARGG